MNLLFYKFLRNNVKPIALVCVCGCIGFLFGSFLTGIVIGLLIVALATLFL